MFIFTQGLHALLIRQDACEKPHFMFELHTVKITYFTDFGVKNTMSIMIMCLQMGL